MFILRVSQCLVRKLTFIKHRENKDDIHMRLETCFFKKKINSRKPRQVKDTVTENWGLRRPLRQGRLSRGRREGRLEKV